jgi:hypothetical protein
MMVLLQERDWIASKAATKMKDGLQQQDQQRCCERKQGTQSRGWEERLATEVSQ